MADIVEAVLWVVHAVLWIVAGCVALCWLYPFLVAFHVHRQNEAAEDQAKSGPGELTKGSNESVTSGSVLRIRVTDDGELCRRSELADATYAIRHHKEGRPEPVLAVWYIHGWRHSPRDGDSDLGKFKGLVERLRDSQNAPHVKRRRHVVGIYVGWNAALGPRGLDLLTFWNRKRAADRISQSAIVTKALCATRHARKKEGCADDMTILIGHSFGARILFSAISQLVIDEVEHKHPGLHNVAYQRIEGPADLVLLMNPAFEASMFTALHALRRDYEWERPDKEQQPKVLAISSQADGATKVLFPLGQFVALGTRKRERQTLGNYSDYVTHDLTRSCEWEKKSDFWYDHFEADGLLLLHRMERRPPIHKGASHWGNPFIVARTTGDIIKNHNDIWNDSLRDWIVSFIDKMERVSQRADTEHRSP